MGQPTHKSLENSFAPPPTRGNKLQGLLKSTPRAPQPAPQAEQTPTESPVESPPPVPATSPMALQEGPIRAGEVDAPQSGSSIPAKPKPTVSAASRLDKASRSQTGATSVYLRTKAYRELVDRRQKKFRSYAQTVYDAFAFIRDKATDDKQDPAEALAKLFDASDATDPWLMPEPRSARNSAEPTVEAKIALKPHERKWVEERMADIGAAHLSPFLATVLEHYLLHGKKN